MLRTTFCRILFSVMLGVVLATMGACARSETMHTQTPHGSGAENQHMQKQEAQATRTNSPSMQKEDSQAAGHGKETQGQKETQGHTLLPTHRVITGTIEAIAADQAKVEPDVTGQMNPRYLPMKRAREKGFTLKPGDQVEMVVNEKNHVVDYHLVNDTSSSDHRVIHGRLVQPMNVGQKQAIITTEDGKEESFPVSPLARSELAAIPLETEALFLIDEMNEIVSAALMGEVESEYQGKEIGWARTPAKGVYRHVDGVVEDKSDDQRLTIRTDRDESMTFPVWEYLKEEMTKLSDGEHVTLLVDHKDRIVDISFSPKEKQ